MSTVSTVSTARAEYKYNLLDWNIINDCIQGQRQIKSKSSCYLPLPAGVNDVKDTKYEKYLSLAMFYNVVSKTSKALCGLAYNKRPNIDNDEKINFINKSVSIENEDIEQFSKKVFEDVINFGRCGILIDYPKVDGLVTLQRKQDENIHAYISMYSTFSIINWHTSRQGAEEKLSMVVLSEAYTELNGFLHTDKTRYRVLELDDAGLYQQRVIYDDNSEEIYYPTDASNKRFTEIPFIFVGSKNNNHKIDRSPLIDLSYMNIKHYQYYADNAIKLHYQAIPLLYAKNLSKDSMERIDSQGGISTGATKGLLLGLNEDVGYIEISETSSLSNEIDKIELKMISAGAKLVKNDAINESATTSKIKASSENSELITIMQNVSSAIKKCMNIICIFEGADSTQNDFRLYTKIVEEVTDYQALSIALNAVTQGQAPKVTIFNGLKSLGLVAEDMTYQEYKELIEQEKESF